MGSKTYFVIPRLPEASYERFFQEYIDREVQLFSFLAGAMADVPSVILQAYRVAYTRKTNGIEVAGDGFLEVYTPCPIGFLYQAIAPAVVVGTSKDAVFVIDDGGNPFPGWVDIGYALRFDYTTGFRGHIGEEKR